MATKPPRWDLTNVYLDLDSPELAKDIDWVKNQTQSLQTYYQDELLKLGLESSKETLNQAVSTMVDRVNELIEKASTNRAYLHSFISTDSFNQQAAQMSSQFDKVMVGIQNTMMMIQSWLGQVHRCAA